MMSGSGGRSDGRPHGRRTRATEASQWAELLETAAWRRPVASSGPPAVALIDEPMVPPPVPPELAPVPEPAATSPEPMAERPVVPVVRVESDASVFDAWARLESAGWAESTTIPDAGRLPILDAPPPVSVEEAAASIESSMVVETSAPAETAPFVDDDAGAVSEPEGADAVTEGQERADDALADETATVRADLAQLENDRLALVRDLDVLRAEHEVRHAAALEAERTVIALTEKTALSRERLGQLATERLALERELDSLRSASDARQAEMAGLERVGLAVAEEVAATRNTLAALAAERVALEQDLRELAAERVRARDEVTVLNGLAVAKREELGDMEQLGRVLADEVTVLEQRLAAGRAALPALTAEAEVIGRDIEAQRLCLDDILRRRSTAVAELEALATERGRQEGEIAALRLVLADLQASAAAAHETLHQRDLAAEERHGLSRQIAALKSELAQSRDENARVKQDIQAGREEFQVIYNRERNVLDKLRRDITLAKRQHEELVGQVTTLKLRKDEKAAVGSNDHEALDRPCSRA